MLKLTSKKIKINKQIKCSSCGKARDTGIIIYCTSLNCNEPYCIFCIKTNKVRYICFFYKLNYKIQSYIKEDFLKIEKDKWICYKCEESISKDYEKPSN